MKDILDGLDFYYAWDFKDDINSNPRSVSTSGKRPRASNHGSDGGSGSATPVGPW